MGPHLTSVSSLLFFLLCFFLSAGGIQQPTYPRHRPHASFCDAVAITESVTEPHASVFPRCHCVVDTFPIASSVPITDTGVIRVVDTVCHTESLAYGEHYGVLFAVADAVSHA